jgi:integrase
MKLDLPNLTQDTDRHGKPRFYVRLVTAGRIRRIRIKEKPFTPQFMAAYSEALAALRAGGAAVATLASNKAAPQGSLGWLAAQYFASTHFTDKNPISQRTRRGIIEDCLREPMTPGSKVTLRDCPYLRVNANHIKMLRDRKAQKKGAANNRLKYMSAMFGWAIEEGDDYKIPHNPCRDVKKLKYATDGFHTWEREEAYQYIERHPLGTQAYFALALILYLGARRQDAIRLGPKNIKDGVMVYVPHKTSYRRVDESFKPILPPLAEAIRCTPRSIRAETFLFTRRGKSWGDASFGNQFKKWCRQAGLPECSAHGLKKLAVTICTDAGATDRQLMALFDWESEKVANAYTRKRNKKKLTAECAGFLGDVFVLPKGKKRTAGAA